MGEHKLPYLLTYLLRLLGYFMAYSGGSMMLTTAVMTQRHQSSTSPVHSTTKVYIKVC